MRILLVEDDTTISSLIKIGLESNNYTVDRAYDSLMGEEFALTEKYDLILLDVLIPGNSGFGLCKKIRKFNSTTPIIMLTSLQSAEDKLTGLACGADDYLVKPFSFDVLLNRIETLIKKGLDLKRN